MPGYAIGLILLAISVATFVALAYVRSAVERERKQQ